MSPEINEKIKALAEFLAIDISEIELEDLGYCVNSRTYEVVTEEESDNVLENETESYIDSIKWDLDHSEFNYLINFIDWNQFINIQCFDLLDFGWEEYIVNNKYYYIRAV